MKFGAIVIVLSFVLGGCVAASKKVSKNEYLSGSAPATATAEDIEDNLKRGKNQYGYYAVEVYPFTKPLIELQAREQGKRALEDETQINKRIANDMKVFGSKNCFHFKIGTHTIEAAKFVNLAAKFEVDGKSYPVTFENVKGVSSVPSNAGFEGYTWVNYSVGCVSELQSFSNFKVILSSLIVRDAPVTTLQWEQN